MLLTDPSGSIYREKRKGPTTQPCGTPQETETLQEDKWPVMAEKFCWSGRRWTTRVLNQIYQRVDGVDETGGQQDGT